MSKANVLLFGVGGLGGYMANEFYNANKYNLSLATRKSSTNAAAKQYREKGVHVYEVDYDDDASLEEAIKGKDVVISTIASDSLLEPRIARIVKQQDVKAFITSAWACFDYADPRITDKETVFPMVEERGQDFKEMDKLGIRWFAVSPGFFGAFILTPMFGFNHAERKITWQGNSDRTTTFTHHADIAAFVRALVDTELSSPGKLQTGFHYVSGFKTTYDDVFAKLGPTWTVERQSIDETKKKRKEDLLSFLKCILHDGLATTTKNSHELVGFTPKHDFESVLNEALQQGAK